MFLPRGNKFQRGLCRIEELKYATTIVEEEHCKIFMLVIREEGVLNAEAEEYFLEEYEKVSYIIFNGEEYRIGNHVIKINCEENTSLYILDC